MQVDIYFFHQLILCLTSLQFTSTVFMGILTPITYKVNKECSENKFLISERVNSIHFEPGLR